MESMPDETFGDLGLLKLHLADQSPANCRRGNDRRRDPVFRPIRPVRLKDIVDVWRIQLGEAFKNLPLGK